MTVCTYFLWRWRVVNKEYRLGPISKGLIASGLTGSLPLLNDAFSCFRARPIANTDSVSSQPLGHEFGDLVRAVLGEDDLPVDLVVLERNLLQNLWLKQFLDVNITVQ